MNVYVTGATGFVGKALIKHLLFNYNAVPLVRSTVTIGTPAVDKNIPVDCIIHLAGRAHAMQETSSENLESYKAVNVDYSQKVAEFARDTGAKRMIYLSSIKVNGDSTDKPFDELCNPHPEDVYGKTKLEAELLLKEFCKKHSIELVIVRPPLIYGPKVKANLKSLINLSKLPIPLPFGKVDNKRSLISLQNLNSFIELCIHHPDAANQTFLISDDHDVSTAELISSIRCGLGLKPRLFPLPIKILTAFFRIIKRKAYSERLIGNLQVDINKAKTLLGWRPICSFEEGIKHMVINDAD